MMDREKEARVDGLRVDSPAPASRHPSNDDGTAELHHRKTEEILDACRWRDIDRLRALAEAQHGFLTDELRRKAWPILLGALDAENPTEGLAEKKIGWRELPKHRDEEQVQLDVNRAFIYYPNNQSDHELERRKVELSDLITEVLRRYPFLCYFQGYHDICQVFLLVLDNPSASSRVDASWRAELVARLSILRIRDFMLPNLAPTVAQLRLIPDILSAADSTLRLHLSGLQPFYALGGTLTMYAHNIEGYHDIARLFDVLLAREPVFSVYMYAQIVLDRREELLDTPADDSSMLHFILSKIPNKLNLETLLAKTKELFEAHPPESLPSWRRISNCSCMKTARSSKECARQTLAEGQECFEQQAKELQWMEQREKILQTMWQYRRPARAIGLAIAVGLAAMYLRRNPGPVNHLISLVTRLAAV